MLSLLFVYIGFLVLYAIYSAMAIYHLRRFGYVGDLTKSVSVVYILLSVMVIVFSIILITTRNWPASFSV